MFSPPLQIVSDLFVVASFGTNVNKMINPYFLDSFQSY